MDAVYCSLKSLVCFIYFFISILARIFSFNILEHSAYHYVNLLKVPVFGGG